MILKKESFVRGVLEYFFHFEAIADVCVYVAILFEWRRNRSLPTDKSDYNEESCQLRLVDGHLTPWRKVGCRWFSWRDGDGDILFMYEITASTCSSSRLCLWDAGLFCNLVLVMWAFLVCAMSCLELTHFIHVAVFIPLLLPFLSRDSLQFYMVLCFNSHPGGDSISFSSTFSDVTVFVVQITEGSSRLQSRKEKKVTDRESGGTKNLSFKWYTSGVIFLGSGCAQIGHFDWIAKKDLTCVFWWWCHVNGLIS